MKIDVDNDCKHQTGISKVKIKEFRQDEITDGNPLPEFEKRVARSQK
jgi:hypothetical protein